MSDTDNTQPQSELTDEQKLQHKAVLDSASHNLDLVIDQVSSLNHADYTLTVGQLNVAREALNQARGLQ